MLLFFTLTPNIDIKRQVLRYPRCELYCTYNYMYVVYDIIINGGRSKLNQILFLKIIGEYIGFCVYRRFYIIWSPVL